jgi:hypothetical protein
LKKGKGKSLGGTGKWAPKLSFEERCGFYYASIIGIEKGVIVLASKLDRGTITRLISRRYKAYSSVHQRFDELGLDKFREAYWTPTIQQRVVAAQAQAAPAAGGV